MKAQSNQKTEHLISKSKKRKMSSTFEVPVIKNGKESTIRITRGKACTFTKEVVIKTKLPGGKIHSQTKHIPA